MQKDRFLGVTYAYFPIGKKSEEDVRERMLKFRDIFWTSERATVPQTDLKEAEEV